MTTKPQNGVRYRYVGECRAYRGLVGVASCVRPIGRIWQCALSNCKEWPPVGLESTIEALSTELEVLPPAPAPSEMPALGALRTVPPASLDPFMGAESDLVSLIIEAAAEQGYKCCHVGQLKAQGSGTTTGYPDLSFRRAGWPCGMACLIEVKAEGGRLSPEQETLFTEGWSRVVWNVAGALEALDEFEDEALTWVSDVSPMRNRRVAA